MTFLPLYLQLTVIVVYLVVGGWTCLKNLLKSTALMKVAKVKLVSVSEATTLFILYHCLTLAEPNASNNIQRSGSWLTGY